MLTLLGEIHLVVLLMTSVVYSVRDELEMNSRMHSVHTLCIAIFGIRKHRGCRWHRDCVNSNSFIDSSITRLYHLNIKLIPFWGFYFFTPLCFYIVFNNELNPSSSNHVFRDFDCTKAGPTTARHCTIDT